MKKTQRASREEPSRRAELMHNNSHFMANPEHLAILKKSVPRWCTWRSIQGATVRPDLSEANLSGADLAKANLSGADLSGSDLSGADLSRANLNEAKLSVANLIAATLDSANLIDANLWRANLLHATFNHANLIRADLGDATLSHTHLEGADLSGANLTQAIFKGARLSGANFTAAVANGTAFVNVNLSSVKGLEQVTHTGPSSIGIEVINRSSGKIPDAFLRGVGVPDNFIAYVGSLAGKPIEFYSCFISYAMKDQAFAERLYADLQAKGVRCWFAPEDIAGGKKLHEQIDEAIRLHDRLLLILSDASMNSNWVKTEIANARAREERQKRQMLFPITLVTYGSIKEWKLFDADRGMDSAREIREYFIPDFSNWKDHDSYQKAFERLLRDLKAEAKEATA
jgi:hypothetical protein